MSLPLSLPQSGIFGGRGFDTRNVNVASNALCCCNTGYIHIPIKLPPMRISPSRRKLTPLAAALPVPPPLDLSEDNIKQVLADARVEFGQIFDTSVGITGQVELAELDGPFVKIRMKGRFWHKRSTVLARLANYLKQRIPEILEVDVEDEKQLDDSPQNF